MDCVSLERAGTAPAARLVEADRDGVLTAPVGARMPAEGLAALAAAAVTATGHAPGSVVVRPGSPVEMRAIVHDLECEPSWREAWVASACRAAFAEVRRRGIDELALPLLGTVYGRLGRDRALWLIARAVAPTRDIATLWIDDPDPDLPRRLLAAIARCRADARALD